MKKGRIILAATTTLAASVWASASFAQASTRVESGAEMGEEIKAGLTADIALSPVFRASDVLLERALSQLEQLPAEVQADVAALQDSLAAIRETWETQYNPGTDATAQELIAAREQFRADLAAEIEASSELRKQVVTQLRDEAREDLEDEVEGELEEELEEDPSDNARQYKEIGMQISAAWREARAELGADATEEEVEAAKDAFIEANAELIGKRKELAAEVRASVGASAAVDRPVVDRGALPEAIQQLKDEMRAAREDLRARRQQAREEMANLSEEEREVRRQELVEELRAANDTMKERRRQLVENLRNERGGDRRSDD